MYNSSFQPPRDAAQSQTLAPLPPGWTEHKAPTGHTYYYNKESKTSTYVRPAPAPQVPQLQPLQPQPLPQQQQPSSAIPSYSAGQFAGGYTTAQFAPNHPNTRRDERPRHQRKPDGDRPKHKYTIPGCAPWVLIKTRYGRRFVHNLETNESLWKFPEDVMKGVVEFDRRERERQERRERGEMSDAEEGKEEGKIVPVQQTEQQEAEESEYEEVTDSEGDDGEENDEGAPSKRQRTEEPEQEMQDAPRDLTEEDMLWQLQEMQQDGDEHAEGDYDYDYEEEPALSDEDAKALFRDLLDDSHISPFTPWDRILESNTLVDDERYLALSTMKARRECFDEWSRARIQVLKEQRERQAKQDPRIAYFQLLDEHASVKLYWPEFKRKFKKEAAMRDMKLAERDKEKYYREHVKRLGKPKDELKKDLEKLLKEMSIAVLNRQTSIDALPAQVLTDLRFISLAAKSRNPVIQKYINALPDAPEDGEQHVDAAAEAEKKRDRERREKALRDREERVQEAKLRQNRDLRYGRERLREREQELERALRVGKDGLKGHFGTDKDEEMRDVGGDSNVGGDGNGGGDA